MIILLISYSFQVCAAMLISGIYFTKQYFEGNSMDVFIVGLPPTANGSQWACAAESKFVWPEAEAPPVEPVNLSNEKLRNRVGWSDVTALSLAITSCISSL